MSFGNKIKRFLGKKVGKREKEDSKISDDISKYVCILVIQIKDDSEESFFKNISRVENIIVRNNGFLETIMFSFAVAVFPEGRHDLDLEVVSKELVREISNNIKVGHGRKLSLYGVSDFGYRHIIYGFNEIIEKVENLEYGSYRDI